MSGEEDEDEEEEDDDDEMNVFSEYKKERI